MKYLKGINLDSIKPIIAISAAHRSGFIAGLEHQQDANAELVEALRGLVAFTVGLSSDKTTESWREDIPEVKAARAALARVGAADWEAE
jgi:hypothetical protein